MQADGAGLWESIPEGKNKECQGLLDLGILLMIENSPLSGEFQKGEAYSCQKEALLCYKKVVLTSVVAKESDNG
mgnify:CR=1 FL=1